MSYLLFFKFDEKNTFDVLSCCLIDQGLAQEEKFCVHEKKEVCLKNPNNV